MVYCKTGLVPVLVATEIDCRPSEWCDCLRGRLRTNKVYQKATGVG